MENIFFCNGCRLEFDKHLNIPKVLNCGHSVCSPCVRKILIESHCCPSCEKKIAGEEDHFPVNLSLISIMKACESYKGMDNDPVFYIQKLKEKYTTTKGFLIEKEAAIKSELEIIENSLERLQDLNDSECCNSSRGKLKESLLTLEKNYETVNKKILSNFGIPKQFVTLSLESFKEENEYLHEIYSKLKKDEKVFAVERIENDLRFAQLSKRDNMILMHTFSYSEAPQNASVILFSELKRCFFKKQLYTFLNVSTGLKDVTHLIIIEMIWNSPLSFDFVKLCTGECGPSYKNSLYMKGLDKQKDSKPLSFVFSKPETLTIGGDKIEANSVEPGNNSNSDEDNDSEVKHNFTFLPTKKELSDETGTSHFINSESTTNKASIFGSSNACASTETPVCSSQTCQNFGSAKTKTVVTQQSTFGDSSSLKTTSSTKSLFSQPSSLFGSTKNTFDTSSKTESTKPSGFSGFSFNIGSGTLQNLENNNEELKTKFKLCNESMSDKMESTAEGKAKSYVLRPANFKFDFPSHNFNFQADKKMIGKIDETSKNISDFVFEKDDQNSLSNDLLASSILRVEKSNKEMLNFEYYHKAFDNCRNYTNYHPGDIIVKSELDHSFTLFNIKQIVTFKPIGKVIHPLNLIHYLSYEDPNNLKVLDCGILFEI